MDALGHERFAVVGHDTGIHHQLRAGRGSPGPGRPRGPRRGPRAPGRGSLTAHVRPRAGQQPALAHPLQPGRHELTEQLVRGREDIFFGYEFAIQAGGKKLPDDALNYYVRLLSDPDALRGSFGLYRAWDTTMAQNEQRAARPLTDARPGDRRSGTAGRTRSGTR